MTATQATTRAAVAWLGLYVGATVLPLFALLPAARGTGFGFAWDFAMALGYAGLAMLGVQFALTARFRRATAPFGIDLVYYFHRYAAVCALGVVALHYLVLRAAYPAMLGSADPRLAPAGLTAGRLALLFFAAVVALALARRILRLEYDAWRIAHALMATAAFVLAYWHVLAAGRYLDTAWKEALWMGYGAFWLGVIVHVRVVRPWRLARSPWRVAEVRPERGRVWTLVLEPPPGTKLRFAPGQFAWLSLSASPFAMREHPFSIASSALADDRIELSIKELGDFTATIGRVAPGTRAYVDAPYGTFRVDAHAPAAGVVFVAGGIGIAPVMSMLRTLADRGGPQAASRPLWLFYGNRVWERVAFREALDELAARLPLRIVHVLLEPPAGWQGETGYIDGAVLARHLPAAAEERARLEYLVCGPNPMTRLVERGLAGLGVPASRVHSEIFTWV